MPVIDLHLSRWGGILPPLQIQTIINNSASQFIEQMKEKGIIYCLHCISTGEKYIGQTKRGLNKRLKYHKYDAEKYKNKNKNVKAKLYIQVHKTGWEDFICGVIDDFELEQLNEKECFYIEKYDTLNNGLNTAPGGGFFPSFSGKDHPLYGVGHTEKTKTKISKNHHDVSGKNNPRSNYYQIEFIDGRKEIVYCLTEWGRLNGYRKQCLFNLVNNLQKSPHKDILKIIKI
jgi:group I intron endonuclease